MTTRDSIVIRNVYHMLAYAFRSVDNGPIGTVSMEEFDHIHDLFAAILANGMSQQIKQGLYREYVTDTDDLMTLRGKIDIPGTTRNRLRQQRAISCEYDEFSENNRLNQVVNSTAILLLRHGDVKPARRVELKKVLPFFSDVDDIDLSCVRWSTFRFVRHNQSYRLLISICRLVVEGMLMDGGNGDRKLLEFVDDQEMSRLYEKFILEYYRRHRPDLRPRASQIAWALDAGEPALLPTMQSDITLVGDGRALIIDAKYYSRNLQVNFNRRTVHSNNLYQVFTYVKNAEITRQDLEVSGMLLYAETDADVQPEARWSIGGSDIAVTTLDLGQDFAGIARKLDEIADGLTALPGS